MKRTLSFMLLKNGRPKTYQEMRSAFLQAKNNMRFKNHEFWLRLTTEEIEEKILLALKAQGVDMDELSRNNYTSFYSFLNYNLIWSHTKEGQPFWIELALLGI